MKCYRKSNAADNSQPLMAQGATPARLQPCGACDNCCAPRASQDWSAEARLFLDCVARLAQRSQYFGAAYIIEVLRGARSERVLTRGHDRLNIHGVGQHLSVDEWRALVRTLLHRGLLVEAQNAFPVLGLNSQSWEVLRGERHVQMARILNPGRDRTAASAGRTPAQHLILPA